MTDLSIIVVNLNTRELLRACLDSLYNARMALQFEVLLIDNGSTDGSVEMVRKYFPPVVITINMTNEGFARPNNAGMRVAKGRYVLLLNSDTVVGPDALPALVAFLESHPEAGACGPMLVYPDGRLQRSVKGFPTLATHLFDMLLLDKVFPRSHFFGKGEMHYFPYDATGEVDHIMAAVFLVRRKVLSSCGLFDERFSIYYNDMDWCYRIRKRGWKIYYIHTSRVVHHLGQTTAKINRRFEYFEELHNNVMLFYRKHYGRWSVVVYKLILALGFGMRSAGWTLGRMFRPNAHSRMMFSFSWRTLWLGLRFWRPLPYAMTPGEGNELLIPAKGND